jgi:2-hydroxychromene-2-carboxylate isomerase
VETVKIATADRSRPCLYFSLRSPYSWLVWQELASNHPQVLEALRWIPFWEPDEGTTALLSSAGASFPYTPMSRAKHLYVLQDVRRLARARGLDVTWPLDANPWWEPSHLAYILAAEEQAGRQWIDRVYRARWQEGLDVCDRDVIGGLAGEVGLDPNRLAGAVEDHSLRERGAEMLLQACRGGIFGVPYFVNRFERFWGIDRLGQFLASLPLPAATSECEEAEMAVVGSSRSTDWGHAGGCG